MRLSSHENLKQGYGQVWECIREVSVVPEKQRSKRIKVTTCLKFNSNWHRNLQAVLLISAPILGMKSNIPTLFGKIFYDRGPRRPAARRLTRFEE